MNERERVWDIERSKRNGLGIEGLAREGADGKRIRDKIWKELTDKIEEYRKEL